MNLKTTPDFHSFSKKRFSNTSINHSPSCFLLQLLNKKKLKCPDVHTHLAVLKLPEKMFGKDNWKSYYLPLCCVFRTYLCSQMLIILLRFIPTYIHSQDLLKYLFPSLIPVLQQEIQSLLVLLFLSNCGFEKNINHLRVYNFNLMKSLENTP